MSDPLNINLIIPFKDNKGDRLELYIREVDRFRESLDTRVQELKDNLPVLLGREFELSIVARSDGNAKKYYWRFKSSKKDRKYHRLHSDALGEYISNFEETQRFALKEIEEELIYINANLKLLKGIKDAIDQANKEKKEWREHSFA